MLPAAPDALIHHGFHEALQRRVMAAAPPDGGKSFLWFLERLAAFGFIGLALYYCFGLVSLTGANLATAGPKQRLCS